MSNEIIAKNLGVFVSDDTPEEMPSKFESMPAIVIEDNKEEQDYLYARENFYNVIEKGTDALEQMLDVAKASEHPRAYEVVSTIMKTLIDANKDLVAMSVKKADSKKSGETDNNAVTNNNLFVGSTAELQSMLKAIKDNE